MQPLNLNFSWDQLGLSKPVCRAPSPEVPKGIIYLGVKFPWCPGLPSFLFLWVQGHQNGWLVGGGAVRDGPGTR